MGTTVFTSYVNNNTGYTVGSEVFSGSRIGTFGTPALNQVTYWKTGSSIQGNGNYTWDGSDVTLTGDSTITGDMSITGDLDVTGEITGSDCDEPYGVVFADASGNLSAGTVLSWNGVQLGATGNSTITATFTTTDTTYNRVVIGGGTGADTLLVWQEAGTNVAAMGWDAGVDKLLITKYGAGAGVLDTNENLASFTPDGAVELYYDDALKFETTNTGVAITGSLASLTVEAVTNYWTCAGGHFDAFNPDTNEVQKTSNGYLKAEENGVNTQCSVSLPHGATVTGVIVYGNAAAVSEESFNMYRLEFADGSGDAMSTGTSIGTEDTSIDNAVVDNSLYSYWIYTSSLDTNDEVWGARVTYTITTL